ncbi:2,4-dienoyl-CoA reductase-like NADH-dependent reductase (Old Yellow Enzyme family) [Pseudarthrobacter defluvii]|uniref:2,4-dienoyl-CoA reductase-like NADH-dependent reductase (Old Yellow Enzyme family) n=1 Tax=Pseudarthrobacter defluvii TaxID=410837 RepID=A0ABT9ULG9_9MICC|nr:NADH:flavin oxidoreductase/NADH oxidase [Pseudarthrobacter defluvii]MDQ0120495.1 2,4-dienoyl-CoA reductase-like NADH-dependent reductase (Old Yellow Enzyme family) [Pseudarthrobacter defluvii]
MPALFQPLALRSMELQHRGWVSPMCQYSCDPDDAPGVPNDWHLVHLGGFAVGGAAMILTEAAAVNAEGRISPRDAGLYNDEQAEAWQRIISFVHRNGTAGTKIGVQLAHAGRKASTFWPFSGRHGSVPAAEGGWDTVGPSTTSFEGYEAPAAMTVEQIHGVIADFAAAAERAVAAGFDTMEIHGAHGYLLHQFQSPLINQRDDEWGGDEAGRNRLMLAVVDAVRAVIPDSMPLLLRISATDWAPGGVDQEASVRLARQAAGRGVDLVDVSSGGAVAHQQIKPGLGYQTGFSAAIRSEAGIATGTVGLVTTPGQAEHAIATGQADGVFIARAALRDPHWWLRAAFELGHDMAWPPQYERAIPRRTF